MRTRDPGPGTRDLFKRLLAAFLLTICTAPLAAQQQRRTSSGLTVIQAPTKGGTATFKYKRLEAVRDEYVILQGDEKEQASVKYQDINVSADKITFNQKTKDLTAEGHVVIDQGAQRLSADTATYNLDRKTGVLKNAKGSFEPSIYFAAEQIEKLDENTFQLTNGVLTSCDIADPDWSFRLGSGTVRVEDYARLRNLSFRAERLPVFWLPYLVWPTKRDRAQGFLIPRVGSNQEFGQYIENSYFIPIGQSMDATLRADFYSEGAVRGGAVFRYVPSTDWRGNFDGYIVNSPDPVPEEPKRKRTEWRYAYQHTHENLPGGFRGVVDVRDYSNLDFLRRFERDFDIQTLSSIYSSAYITKNRPYYALNIRADRREHLTLAFEESVVFEQMPSIQYTVYPMQVGNSPVYFALESSAAQLRRKERSAGQFLSNDYLRGDFFPTLSLQLKTPPWVSVKPQLSLRETYYSSSIDLATGLIGAEELNRRYAQGQVEIVGPSFSRIYNGGIPGFGRFKHVIEPRARYLYTTDVDDQNRVIRFDTVDSPFLPLVRDSVEYSLTQRILAKPRRENASAREIMSVTLRQSVSLAEPFRTVGTDEHHFTPLALNVRVNPYQSVRFDANAQFGNVSHQLDQLNLSANLTSEQRYVNFTWFATMLQPGRTTDSSSQFRISGGSPIWRDKLRADVHLNYDAERELFLERRYATLFTASCYGIALEAREFQDFRSFQPDGRPTFTRDYQITIDLKNVGPIRGSF